MTTPAVQRALDAAGRIDPADPGHPYRPESTGGGPGWPAPGEEAVPRGRGKPLRGTGRPEGTTSAISGRSRPFLKKEDGTVHRRTDAQADTAPGRMFKRVSV
jgi:hypothetical protein